MKGRSQYRIKPGERVSLEERDPADASALPGKEAAKEQTLEDAEAIDALQDRLYAEGRRALLVILQGTDTSGKDGTIRHGFNATGPLGVSVTAFRAPNEERAHDYLWRAHLACPRRGTIGIFNRSHYEEVLIARVKRLAPPDAIEALLEHPWPGNVRELRNVIERAVLLAGEPVVRAHHLGLAGRGSRPAGAVAADAPAPSSGAAGGAAGEVSSDRAAIEDALVRCGGNQSRAAEMLGIPRRTLIRRIEQLKLPRPRKYDRSHAHHVRKAGLSVLSSRP